MPWVRLDDGFADHPKVERAGPLAGWLHVVAMCYCARHLTDGRVPKVKARRLADIPQPTRHIAALVEAGLWHEDGDDYVLHDFLDYQPARAEVEAERKAARDRMAKARSNKRRSSPEQSANVPANNQRSSGNPDPTRPVDNSSSSDSRGADPPEEGRNTRRRQEQRVETALSILADRDLTDRQTRSDREPLHDVDAWTRKAIQGRRARHGAELVRLAFEHPRLNPTELADRLDDRLDHRLDDPQAAARARQEAGSAQAHDLAQTAPDPELNVAGTSAARRALRSVPQEPDRD
jgi:hypothetical protein